MFFADIDCCRERGLPGVRRQRDRLSEEERDPLQEAVLQARATLGKRNLSEFNLKKNLLTLFASHTSQEDS